MPTYSPRDWYWIVADDETQVFSSRVGDFVPISNADYVAWRTDGSRPTRIASVAELGDVLGQARVRPVHAGVLDAYLDQQAGTVIDLVQFKIIFNHENRMRAIERALGLNGNPANLTPAQARNAVKVLL